MTDRTKAGSEAGSEAGDETDDDLDNGDKTDVDSGENPNAMTSSDEP